MTNEPVSINTFMHDFIDITNDLLALRVRKQLALEKEQELLKSIFSIIDDHVTEEEERKAAKTWFQNSVFEFGVDPRTTDMEDLRTFYESLESDDKMNFAWVLTNERIYELVAQHIAVHT